MTNSNICNILYHHKYSPTIFDAINNPWFKPNSCPFANMPPTNPPITFQHPNTLGSWLIPFNTQPITSKTDKNTYCYRILTDKY